MTLTQLIAALQALDVPGETEVVVEKRNFLSATMKGVHVFHGFDGEPFVVLSREPAKSSVSFLWDKDNTEQ